MVYCLMPLNHHQNHRWLLICEVLKRYPFESNFTAYAQANSLYDEFENYTFKIIPISPRGRWVTNQCVPMEPLCNFAGNFRRHLFNVREVGSAKHRWKLAMCKTWNLTIFWSRLLKCYHYIDVIMTTMTYQITSLTVVYSIVYSGADQRKHQSSASLAFVRGIHRDRWIPDTKGQ